MTLQATLDLAAKFKVKTERPEDDEVIAFAEAYEAEFAANPRGAQRRVALAFGRSPQVVGDKLRWLGVVKSQEGKQLSRTDEAAESYRSNMMRRLATGKLTKQEDAIIDCLRKLAGVSDDRPERRNGLANARSLQHVMTPHKHTYVPQSARQRRMDKEAYYAGKSNLLAEMCSAGLIGGSVRGYRYFH